jgi:tetratricopeptide (TPR) repeat protein
VTGQSDRGDRQRRWVAVSLGALVLLGGVLAILRTDASVEESSTARETTRVAVRALRSDVRAEAVQGAEAEGSAERDFLGFRRPFLSDPTLSEAVGAAGASDIVAEELRAARRSLPAAAGTARLDRLRVSAARGPLKQHASATTRITWNRRTTQYTTIIAVLAAGLFFVGFALTVEGSLRLGSYALGMAVAIFAAGWAVWVHHLPIPTTPDAAVEATARGSVLSEDGRYADAIASFDRAIAVDGGFAPAYTGRARAELLRGNPDYSVTGAFTDTSGAASAAAVRDIGRALDLGGRDDILGLALEGLDAFAGDDPAEAARAVDGALALDAGVPDLWLLKSAAEVALGHDGAAGAALDRAQDLLRRDGPSQRLRVLSSRYLGNLELVAHNRPERTSLARELSDRMVAFETSLTLGRPLAGTPPARGTAAVRDLRATRSRLGLTLRWTDLPARTALSAVAYERPLPEGAWAQPVGLALFVTLGGSGERRISVPLTRACAPTEVRVVLYLDGARTGSQTGPGVTPTC